MARVDSVIESHYTGVVQTSQDLDFLLESFDSLVILQQLVPVILLDSHFLVRALDDTSLHRSEGSLAYQHLDIIVFERCQVWAVKRYGTHVPVRCATMLRLIFCIIIIAPFGGCPLETGTTFLDLVVDRAAGFSYEWSSGTQWRFQTLVAILEVRGLFIIDCRFNWGC